ncbi:MAG: CotH kinase family protein [Clostridia bacterium]|nr:CotH kinase family protein [Clostridia bacterium]
MKHLHLYNRILRALLAVLLTACVLMAAACDPVPQPVQESSAEETATPEPSEGSGETSLPESTLRITELASGQTGIRSPGGSYCGWIELGADGNVSTSGYGLRIDDGPVSSLPESDVQEGRFLLLYADDADCPFQLNKSGRITLLYGNEPVQAVDYSNPTDGTSYLPAEGMETTVPTPGEANVLETDQLMISEIMSRNDSFPVDGRICDWIELYNAGNDPVNLSLYYLSDRDENRYLCALPAQILGPGEYVVFPCGGETVTFNLKKKGETVYLTKSGGVCVQALSFGEIPKDCSLISGGVTDTPSPGYPNTRDGMMAYLAARDGLLINEVLSANAFYRKHDGVYCDMVEIRNGSGSPIDLSGYCLTDRVSKPDRLRLPKKTLDPDELLVLYLDSDSENGLGVSRDGESLYLIRAKDGYVSDALRVPALPNDVSYGRTSAGTAYFENPTFGEPNGEGYSVRSRPPEVSLPGGIYEKSVAVTLSGAGDIYYTSDGSVPTASSRKYAGEAIPFEKAGTLRAVCREPDGLLSEETTATYLVDIPDLELPILSVTVDEDGFFGSNGVWSTWKKTELPAHATYLKDGKEEFSLSCGVKLFGLGSVQFAKKSIRLKFKKKYGPSKLNYDVFEDGEIVSFDSLVVRAGGQGMWRCILNDEFVSSFLRSTGNVPSLLSQKYRPVNLYINGRYMGLYCFREKIDEDFISARTGCSPDSVSVVFRMTQGERGSDCKELTDLLAFIEKNDLRVSENYDYVKAHFDLENLIDYWLCEIWCGNIDTLNVRMYKSSDGDGKWRFLFYDLDRAFYRTYPAADLYLQSSNVTTRPYSGILYRFLKNEDFRTQFLERLDFHLENTFVSARAVEHLREMMAVIDHDIRPDIERWKGEMNAFPQLYPQSYDIWIRNCENVIATLMDGYGENMRRLVRKNVSNIH